MRLDTDALRVLHDPVSYYRPWHNRSGGLCARQRSALNRWLVREHGLRAPAALCNDHAPLADRLLANWHRVPGTAWLMACAGQRRALMGSRLLLAQPSVVHAFMRLGFREAKHTLDTGLKPEDLLAWGGNHLQMGLQERLPGWLADRLRLCFAGLPVASHRAGESEEFDMTCFWSAWNHAAGLPGRTVGLCG